MEDFDVSVHAVWPGCRPSWVSALLFPAPSPWAALAPIVADFEAAGWSLRRLCPDSARLAPPVGLGVPAPCVELRAVPRSAFPAFALPLRAAVYPDPLFCLSAV